MPSARPAPTPSPPTATPSSCCSPSRSQRTGNAPSDCASADLDAAADRRLPAAPGDDRRQRRATRNARLAAIHSLFRYAALRHPEHAAVIQRVLAIPPKRFDRAVVTYLTAAETDALLAAPDRTTWTGRRDHALLLVAIQTGLRVSELTGLTLADVHLGTGAAPPLPRQGPQGAMHPADQPDRQVLRAWLRRTRRRAEDPLFPTRRGTPLSRDAVEQLVTKHATTAATRTAPPSPSKNVTPHTLRHSTAMALAPRRRRHLRDRALARSRVSRNHPDLPARRHEDQRTRTRTAPRHPAPARPLHRPRHPAGVPRQTL